MSYDNGKYDFLRNKDEEDYQEDYEDTSDEDYEEDENSDEEEYEGDEEYEDDEDSEEDEEYDDEEYEEDEEYEDEEYEDDEDSDDEEEYEEDEDDDEEYEEDEDSGDDEEYDDEEYEEDTPFSTAHLTLNDYAEAAAALGVETAAILAVKEVELGNKPAFVQPGQPRILFEGHIFWRQLKKRGINPEQYVRGNEDVLYPKWTRSHYTNSGQGEYARLQKAMAIDEKAALASASWGMFQIMGFNYKVCGCRNINEFVEVMSQSEAAQLQLFMNFLQANGQDDFLRNHDWAGFARSYNGPGYAQNRYDVKLRDAYRRHC